MQPHTMMFPPPNFTVPVTLCFSSPVSVVSIHFIPGPSLPLRLILVSSDQMTLFQSSNVHSRCFWAHLRRALRCFALSKGFFLFLIAFIPSIFKALRTVQGLMFLSSTLASSFATCGADWHCPVLIRRLALRLDWGVSAAGRPPLADCSRSERFWRSIPTTPWETCCSLLI